MLQAGAFIHVHHKDASMKKHVLFLFVNMGNSKIKWNFKKNKKLKVELNTVCQWLVVCLKFM